MTFSEMERWSDLHTDPLICQSNVAGEPLQVTMADIMAEIMADDDAAFTLDTSPPGRTATHGGVMDSMTLGRIAKLLDQAGMRTAIAEDFRGTPHIHVGYQELQAPRSEFGGASRSIMVLAPKLIEDHLWMEATSPMGVACHVLFDVPADQEDDVVAALGAHYAYLSSRIEADLDTEAWCDQAVEELLDHVALAAEAD